MSDNTCKTCKMWQEPRLGESGICHRFPCVAARKPDDWCGEWSESKVTDEHTICSGFGVPLFKVTERENGTSTTEPVPDETPVDTQSRWYELFGTPERAARTLERFELDRLDWCGGSDCCEKCPYEFNRCECYLPDGFSLLEWLRCDAE